MIAGPRRRGSHRAAAPRRSRGRDRRRREPIHTRRVRRRSRRAIRCAVDPPHETRMGRHSTPTRSPSRGRSPTTNRSRRASRRVKPVARADEAHSVHVVVDVPAPSFFRFRTGDWTSPTGRVAPTGVDPAQLRVAAATCQRFETGFYAAHRDLVEWAPDLVIFLGDFIYEYGAQDLGGAVVRSLGSGETLTIEEYRQRYALYLSDAAPAGVTRRVPVAGDLGRPRGGEQLRGGDVGGRRSARRIRGPRASPPTRPGGSTCPCACRARAAQTTR